MTPDRHDRVRYLFVALSCVFIAGAVFAVFNRDRNMIQYVLHFDLTDDEVAALPIVLADFATRIKERTVESFDADTIERLVHSCPIRRKGRHQIRLIWGIDNESAVKEADACLRMSAVMAEKC